MNKENAISNLMHDYHGKSSEKETLKYIEQEYLSRLTKFDLMLQVRKDFKTLRNLESRVAEYSFKLLKCECGGKPENEACGAFDSYRLKCSKCGKSKSHSNQVVDYIDFWKQLE